MTASPTPDATFDAHAESYEAEPMQGLRLSGESKGFYARRRLVYLRDWWRRVGWSGPLRIIDYGCGVGDVSALLAETFPGAEVLGLDPSTRCVARPPPPAP